MEANTSRMEYTRDTAVLNDKLSLCHAPSTSNEELLNDNNPNGGEAFEDINQSPIHTNETQNSNVVCEKVSVNSSLEISRSPKASTSTAVTDTDATKGDTGCLKIGPLSDEASKPQENVGWHTHDNNSSCDDEEHPGGSGRRESGDDAIEKPQTEESNNNQYNFSTVDAQAKSDTDLNEVTPEESTASDFGNEGVEEPSRSTSTTGSNQLEDIRQPGQSTTVKGTGKGKRTENVDTSKKKTFDQLNPTEIKCLRTSLGEIVKKPSIGTPNLVGDDEDDGDYASVSEGTINHRLHLHSAYSATIGSSDSIVGTEKGSDISSAEYDFASVVPSCKGTIISFKDRTQEDAQALLNQIINGEPDPCLGPDGFGFPQNTGDGYGRKIRGSTPVKKATSNPILSDESAESEEKEEAKNVSLHNAVAMNVEASGIEGVLGFIAPDKRQSKIFTSDKSQRVPCQRSKLENDNSAMSSKDVNGAVTAGSDNDIGAIGDHRSDNCNIDDGSIGGGGGGGGFGGDGGGGGGCDGARNTSLVVNVDIIGEGCDLDSGHGNPEIDENYKDSYEECVRLESLDDSVIDSVIMENCDDGGEVCHLGSTTSSTTAGDGEREEGNGDEADNVDICHRNEQNESSVPVDNEDNKSPTGDNFDKIGERVVELSPLANDCRVQEKMLEGEQTSDDVFQDWNFDEAAEEKRLELECANVIYTNYSKNEINIETVMGHQENPKAKGTEDEETVKQCDNKVVESVSLDAGIIERQLKCNENSLPFVALPAVPHQGIEGHGNVESNVKQKTMNPMDDYGKDMMGVVCPCNSEVYSCDLTPNTKQTNSHHLTRLNGIREILKATELYFNESNAEAWDCQENESPPSSVGTTKQTTKSTLFADSKPSSSSARATGRCVSVNGKHFETKLKAVSRNKAPYPGRNTSKWTLDKKKKPVLPDINNKTKMSRSRSRGGTHTGGRATSSTAGVALINPTSRSTKVGLNVKRLNITKENRKTQPKPSNEGKPVAESPVVKGPKQGESAIVAINPVLSPPLESKLDGSKGDNQLQDSNDYVEKSDDINTKKETPSSDFGSSAAVDDKKRMMPIPPSFRAPRNVNANKTTRLSHYVEMINTLEMKRCVALSCSATSSACTVASYMRDPEDSMFCNQGDDCNRRKADGFDVPKLRGGSSISDDSCWNTPIGVRQFVPPLRRLKLESSVLYKPKRHLNPKNASTEEYHRYKMDLRLSQSLAKIKRGPPTVDCYLDPRLRQKPQIDNHRSRSRSQKRLPEVTR